MLRELELEETINSFKKDKDRLYREARDEGAAKERARFEKHIQKLERVKLQELKLAKRDYATTV